MKADRDRAREGGFENIRDMDYKGPSDHLHIETKDRRGDVCSRHHSNASYRRKGTHNMKKYLFKGLEEKEDASRG